MKNKIKTWSKRLVITAMIITMPLLSVLSVSAGQTPPPPHAAPIAVLVGPKYAYTGDNVILDGSGSYSGGVWYVTQYNFDYGKGAGWQGWQSPSTATTTYTTAGAYTAQLKVMDNSSLVSAPTSKTVFINGDSALTKVAEDVPFNHWVVNQNVDFNVEAQVSNGGDAYWINVTQVNIYDSILPSHIHTALGGDHWETTTDPLHAGGAHVNFDYSGIWSTIKAGSYWIRMQCYDGNSYTWSDYHLFYVWSI